MFHHLPMQESHFVIIKQKSQSWIHQKNCENPPVYSLIFRGREKWDKTDWKNHGRPAVVNAFYSSIENSIQFPAGILQEQNQSWVVLAIFKQHSCLKNYYVPPTLRL